MAIIVRGKDNIKNEIFYSSFETFIKVWEIFTNGGRNDSNNIRLFNYINDNKISITIKTSGMEISFVY